MAFSGALAENCPFPFCTRVRVVAASAATKNVNLETGFPDGIFRYQAVIHVTDV